MVVASGGGGVGLGGATEGEEADSEDNLGTFSLQTDRTYVMMHHKSIETHTPH